MKYCIVRLVLTGTHQKMEAKMYVQLYILCDWLQNVLAWHQDSEQWTEPVGLSQLMTMTFAVTTEKGP